MCCSLPVANVSTLRVEFAAFGRVNGKAKSEDIMVAMRLARPACGDPVATQRTHGSSVYLKKDTIYICACAHCAPRCLFHLPKATHSKNFVFDTFETKRFDTKNSSIALFCLLQKQGLGRLIA